MEDWVNWAQSSFYFIKIYAIKFELYVKSFYIIIVKQNKYFNCFVKHFNKSVNILIDR